MARRAGASHGFRALSLGYHGTEWEELTTDGPGRQSPNQIPGGEKASRRWRPRAEDPASRSSALPKELAGLCSLRNQATRKEDTTARWARGFADYVINLLN